MVGTIEAETTSNINEIVKDNKTGKGTTNRPQRGSLIMCPNIVSRRNKDLNKDQTKDRTSRNLKKGSKPLNPLIIPKSQTSNKNNPVNTAKIIIIIITQVTTKLLELHKASGIPVIVIITPPSCRKCYTRWD